MLLVLLWLLLERDGDVSGDFGLVLLLLLLELPLPFPFPPDVILEMTL